MNYPIEMARRVIDEEGAMYTVLAICFATGQFILHRHLNFSYPRTLHPLTRPVLLHMKAMAVACEMA